MARERTDLVELSAEIISQQKVIEFVTHPSAGGIAVFIGKQQSFNVSVLEIVSALLRYNKRQF